MNPTNEEREVEQPVETLRGLVGDPARLDDLFASLHRLRSGDWALAGLPEGVSTREERIQHGNALRRFIEKTGRAPDMLRLL